MTPQSDAIAHWLLERLEIPYEPPVDLELLAKRMGVTAIHDVDMAADGMLEQDGKHATVFIRVGLNPGRRNFTLAHELAHRVLIHPNVPTVAYRRNGESDDEERLCDEIAAALLLPAPWMLSLRSRPQNLSTLRLISHRANVSLSAALVRSRETIHWRRSLLRFSLDQRRWRFQGAAGVPFEWHRSIRSAVTTHDVLANAPMGRDCERLIPLHADAHEFEAPAQIDKRPTSAVVLAELDQQLALLA